MKKLSSFLAHQWLGNIRVGALAGMVMAFALIPKAIAFTGGRVAMISAATTSTAVLMGGLVRSHGVQYLFAATILMGLFQILAGVFKLDQLTRFISRSVITRFVNALAILIFRAQMPQLAHVPPATYGLIALGLAIIYVNAGIKLGPAPV